MKSMKRILSAIMTLVMLSLVTATPIGAVTYHPEDADHSAVYLCGDADDDGSVTIIDATAIQRIVAELPAAAFNEKAADVDGNGTDIMDATRIQRYIAEFDDPYGVGERIDERMVEFELPSRVDLRSYHGKNYVTPVKYQLYGDCWSFALASAAETAYLYANDMGVPAGEINNQVNFSEKYIAWYMFHGITGDDVNAGRVRASQVGEGFDPSAAEKSFDRIAYVIGGAFIHDANLFGAGFGPVDESVEVNGEYPYAYNDDASVEWLLPLNAAYRCAPTNAYLRNSSVLPPPASYDADGNYALNTDGLDAIRSELYQGHGVSIALCSTHAGFNAKKRAAYCYTDSQPDHAVAVVGYDDDYPKENFMRKKSKGVIDENSIPPENGALIIKNSWGLTTNDGDIDDGYVYVSYYDRSLMSALSYTFDGGESLRHTNVNIDQYDLMMTNWYGSTAYEAETKTANIFEAEEDADLYQIAYRTSAPDTEVRYEIYKDVAADDPSSGKLLETGVSRHPYAGSCKIDLRRNYALKKGERYAVVLTMKQTTDSGTVYTEVFPYSTGFFEGMTVRGVVNEGESWLYTDGKWRDMTSMRDSLKERAYQYCEESLRSDPSLPRLSLQGKDDMTFDNYPIKAILAPR